MSSEPTPIRNKIKSLLHAVRLDIVEIQRVQDEIDMIETKSGGSGTDFKTFEDFTNNHMIDTIELVDTLIYSTLCQECSEVCHENCDPDEMILIGDQTFQQCHVIKDGNCRQCKNKCSSVSHYHAGKTIVRSKKKMRDVIHDVRVKYDRTRGEKITSQNWLTTKGNALNMLKIAVKDKMEGIKQLWIKLCQICGTSDVMQEVQLFINQLARECIVLKSTYTRHQATEVIDTFKDLCNSIAAESQADMNTLIRVFAKTARISKDDDENTNSRQQVKTSGGINRMNGVGDKELQEVLLDELTTNQKTSKQDTSLEVEEVSTRMKPIRNKIISFLHAVRLDIVEIQRVRDEIDSFEIKSSGSGPGFKTFEDFTNNHMIDTIELVDTLIHSTLCQECSDVCHENCDPDEMILIGDQIFQQCHVIKDGNCRQCKNKCSSVSHYHAGKTIVRSKKKMRDVIHDVRVKYDRTKDEKNTIQNKLITKGSIKNILDIILKERVNYITQFCIQLQVICPHYEIKPELQVFIDLFNQEYTISRNNDAEKYTYALISDLRDLYTTLANSSNLLERSLLEVSITQKKHIEKPCKDAKPGENIEQVLKTHQSPSVKNSRVNNIPPPKIQVSNEKDSPSLTASKIKKASEAAKQEILDTSGMAKILIIGETGSGKSTFINYLLNYFYNGNLQNLHVAIPSKFHSNVTEKFAHCENDIQNTTQSKTDNCNQYMFSVDSKQYLFVDTPGLSDTRGTEQDDRNVSKIVDSVEKLGGLTAVIIVVNGAVSRLTINLRNVLTRLRGNLPDVIMDNVLVLLTNVTRYAANFSISALELNGNVYPYYMQNSAFSQDPSTWTPAILGAIQHDFDRSMNEIRNMIKTIDTFQTKSVIAFKRMKDIRSEIKTLFHEAHLEVAQIQKLQDEIHIFENLVKQCDSDLVTYKDYTEEREIDTTEIVDDSVCNTLCGQCNQVCHENCLPDESTTTSSQFYNQCWVFKNGYCRQCTGKCSYKAHYYTKKTIKTIKKKIQSILSDIKFRYDQASEEKNTYQKNITSKEDARKILDNALKQKNEEIKQLCLKLREICAGFDYIQELLVFINQLEAEENMLRSIEAKQQAAVLIRSLHNLCKTLANDPDLQNKTPSRMNIIDTDLSIDNWSSRTSANPTNNYRSSAQENAPANTSHLSISSESYANDDVLATIRAISKKKMTQNADNKKSNEKMNSRINNHEKK